MPGLIAVITDGLGSTRLDVYDSGTMRALPRREGWSRPGEVIASSDGRLWFDWPDIVEGFLAELRDFERAAEIERLVPVARGAVIGLVDSSGRLSPAKVTDYSGARRRGGVISYFSLSDPETDTLIEGMAPARERYELYGVPPNFTGYGVPGWAIADLAVRYPESLQSAGAVAFGPELYARLLCGEAPPASQSGLEITYLMCHTGLYKDGAWSALARDIDSLVAERTGRKLLGDLLPPRPGRSAEVYDFAELVEHAGGARIRIPVLKGGHDSTLADVPLVAAGHRVFGGRDFIHFQAGSWGMARLVTAEGGAKLPDRGFGRHVMYQSDLDGRLVLTALAPTGIEFKNYAAEDPGAQGVFLRELGIGSLPHEFQVETVRRVASDKEIFVLPGVAKGTGPFPESDSRVRGMERLLADRSGELAYVSLNLATAVMSVTTIELVARGGGEPVVLSAGGASDPLFRLLVASLMPGREVFYLSDGSGEPVTETTSAGAFMLGLESLEGDPAYSIDVSRLGYGLEVVRPDASIARGLSEYREEYVRLAGGP